MRSIVKVEGVLVSAILVIIVLILWVAIDTAQKVEEDLDQSELVIADAAKGRRDGEDKEKSQTRPQRRNGGGQGNRGGNRQTPKPGDAGEGGDRIQKAMAQLNQLRNSTPVGPGTPAPGGENRGQNNRKPENGDVLNAVAMGRPGEEGGRAAAGGSGEERRGPPGSGAGQPGTKPPAGDPNREKPANKPNEGPVIAKEDPPKSEPASSTPAETGAARIYVVASGDTLSGIASAELGSTKFVDEILALNPKLSDPSKIFADMKLKLPGKILVSATKPEGSKPVAETPKPAADPFTTHVVAKGETLYEIARLHYGDQSKWRLVRNANRDVIVGEDGLRPGKRLRIPR